MGSQLKALSVEGGDSFSARGARELFEVQGGVGGETATAIVLCQDRLSRSH